MDFNAQRLAFLSQAKAAILAQLPCSVEEALEVATIRAGGNGRYARTAIWDLLAERKVLLRRGNQLSNPSPGLN